MQDKCCGSHVALDKYECSIEALDSDEGLEGLSQSKPIGYRDHVRVGSTVLCPVGNSPGAE